MHFYEVCSQDKFGWNRARRRWNCKSAVMLSEVKPKTESRRLEGVVGEWVSYCSLLLVVKIEMFINRMCLICIMIKQDWRVRFRELWPSASERRVPIDETPEEVICEIDRTLRYTGTDLGKGYSTGNYLYLVRDSSDGLEKVLKVASAPANVSKAHHEHRILHKLNQNRVIGVPRVFRFYNSIDSEYNSDKFTAMLREYVDAEEFDACLRGSDVYKRLDKLIGRINRLGVSLLSDFNGRNVRVNSEGQPYILDFEESSLSKNPIWDLKGNYRKIYDFYIWNVQAYMERSKNPISRILSKSPEAVKLIVGLFYKGPIKPTSYGW